MHTTLGVVKTSGSLIPFLRLEVTTCQGLFALVAPDLVFRRRTAAAAEEFFLPLLDSNLIKIVLVLLTGIQKPGNIVAHATESVSHCGHLAFGNSSSLSSEDEIRRNQGSQALARGSLKSKKRKKVT